MSKLNIKDVMVAVVELLLSRDGDITTEDGDFSTCGTDEIIRLDCAVASFLDLDCDDVNSSDLNLIRCNINKLIEPQSKWISPEAAKQQERITQLIKACELISRIAAMAPIDKLILQTATDALEATKQEGGEQ